MKSLLFIHHSTGGNLLREGKVRLLLKKAHVPIQFWDHNYNLYPIFPTFFAQFTHHKGLSDGEGNITGKDFNIVLSNNSPKEYAEIFSRKSSDPTLEAILSYDIIAFKNCFPTTRIRSDQQLQEDIQYYQQIRESLKKYPDKTFILFTPPPLRKELTRKVYAQRAMKLVVWLNSKEFLQNTKNIVVFDFFSLLADTNGFLKKEYTRLIPLDSHPNKKANEEVGEKFVECIQKIV